MNRDTYSLILCTPKYQFSADNIEQSSIEYNHKYEPHTSNSTMARLEMLILHAVEAYCFTYIYDDLT